MRKYILAVLLLVLMGVGASLYLIPNEKEVATMRSYDAANRGTGIIENVEDRFIEGDRSIPVMIGMADKYLAEGKDTRPLIPEYDAFVQANPKTDSVRVRLAQMYRTTDDGRNYLLHMKIVATNAPTASNMALLAEAYGANREFGEQSRILKDLIERSNGSVPEYYVSLAFAQTELHEAQAALETLNTIKTNFPEYSSYDLSLLEVTNYVNTGQMEEAYTLALKWLETEVDPQRVAEMTDVLNYGGRADMAVELSDPHSQMSNDDAYFMQAYVNALISSGNEDRALELLRGTYDTGSLNGLLYRQLISLAIDQDMEYAQQIVAELKPEFLSQSQSMDVLELTYIKKTPALRDSLIARLDDATYLADKPALYAVIALARRDNDEDLKISAALAAKLNKNEQLRLAESCARNQKQACFDRLVANYPSFDEMTPQELDKISSLYVVAGRASEITEAMEAQVEKRQLAAVRYSAARLAVANNEVDKITSWLQQEGDQTATDDLQALYFVNNDGEHGEGGLLIAEALYQREPSSTHRTYLINAYIRTGTPGKALPLLREEMAGPENKEDHSNAYIAALMALAPKEEEYRVTLREYVMPMLDSDEVTPERKYELIFALIDSGQMEYAKPYIDRYSKEYAGDWRVLYNQVYAVNTGINAGPVEIPITERSRSFRVKMASAPKTSRNVKRQLAFSLLDDGYRADATNIFFELAQTAGPKSEDMNDLLYLWGPRLNQQQMGWLTQRANSARSQAERIAWAELIANQTDDFGLMRYVTDHPEMLDHPALRKRYFVAMAQYSDKERFVDGMKRWVDSTSDTSALQDYAAAAIGGTFPEGAMYALRRIERLDPNHQWALKQLAVLNYSRADYSQAETVVNRFMENTQQAPVVATGESSPYEVLFYKAGLLRLEGKQQEANAYYQQLVNLAEREADTAAEQSLYYSSLYQLGHKDLARQGFVGLLRADPSDKGLLADYLDVLIEGGEVSLARQVANQYDQHPNRQPQTIPVDATNVQSIIPHENGRELELRYDQQAPQSLMPEVSPKNGWIEGVSRGHDSIVIAAKPGYVLRFTPTADQYSQVVASPVRTSSPKERLEVQQQLRLQLLYARMELESNQTEQARERIESLRPYFSDNPQYLGYAANVENAAGNWPRAMRLIADAQNLQPENEDIQRLHRDMNRQYGQEIKIDHTWRSVAESNEQITTLSGRVRPTYNTELGAIVQNDVMDARSVRRGRDGTIGNYDVTRQRAELYGSYYFENGDALRASLFANNDTPGGGAYYSFNNPLGRSELMAEYKRPYWDFNEAVVDQATRDSIGAKHIAELDERTSLSGEVALSRYHSEVDDDLADTARVQAYLVRRIQDAGPKIFIGYGFDGEYVMNYETRTDVNGGLYRTLPVVSREVHYPFVTVGEDITEQTYIEGTAGWAYDRLGEQGPQVNGRITHDITDDVEAELRASYGLQANDSDQNITQVGGHLKYQF